MRYYVAPANIKTTRAERGIRAIKELVRIILESLIYIMPYKWTIKSFGDYSIIYGRFYDGVYQERVYSRKVGETHKVLTHTNIEILVIDIHDGKYTATPLHI